MNIIILTGQVASPGSVQDCIQRHTGPDSVSWPPLHPYLAIAIIVTLPTFAFPSTLPPTTLALCREAILPQMPGKWIMFPSPLMILMSSWKASHPVFWMPHVMVCLLANGVFLFSFYRWTYLLFSICFYDWIHCLLLFDSSNTILIKLWLHAVLLYYQKERLSFTHLWLLLLYLWTASFFLSDSITSVTCFRLLIKFLLVLWHSTLTCPLV